MYLERIKKQPLPMMLLYYKLILSLSNDLYLPAIIAIQQQFGETGISVYHTMTAWFVGAALFQLIAGPLCDKIGRRPMMISGAILFVTASLMCMYSMSMPFLVAARFIQGMSVSMVNNASLSSIHEHYEREVAIKLSARLNIIGILGALCGPLLGVFLMQWMSWQGLFGLLAVAALIGLLWLDHAMPETRAAVSKHSINIKRTIGQYSRIITHSGFICYTLPAGLLAAGSMMWITEGPLLFHDVFGKTPESFAVAQMAVCSSYVVGALLLTKLSVKSAMKFGKYLMILAALSMICLSFYTKVTATMIVFTLMVFNLSSGLSFSALQRLAVENLQADMGCRVAMQFSIGRGMSAFGASCASVFYDQTIASFTLMMFALTLITSLLMINAMRHQAQAKACPARPTSNEP